MHVGLLLGGTEDGDPRAIGDQHGEQGRQQSTSSTKPELTQSNSVGALELLDQQRGDEEPETTKNTSTPRKPPCIQLKPAW